MMGFSRPNETVKGATSRFAHLEKFSLTFSSSSFAIRLNLLHPQPSLFLFGFLSPLWCFSTLVNYYFEVSFSFKVILYIAKMTSNIVTCMLLMRDSCHSSLTCHLQGRLLPWHVVGFHSTLVHIPLVQTSLAPGIQS